MKVPYSGLHNSFKGVDNVWSLYKIVDNDS